MALRDVADMVFTAARRPEETGCKFNDRLATTLVTGLCKPDATFIDVGAHIGSIAAAVIRMTRSKVIAVEAMPDKALALSRKFPTATVHSCAASDREGEATFFVDRDQSGYSSLGSHRAGTEAITVAVRRLDALVDASDVDIIKIDVEGAELGVLRGAEAMIARCRPVVMFESAPPQEDGLGYSKADMHHWFSAHSYELLAPDRMAHFGPGLSLDGFLDSHWYPRRTTNYFGVPTERREEVRGRVRRLLKLEPSER